MKIRIFLSILVFLIFGCLSNPSGKPKIAGKSLSEEQINSFIMNCESGFYPVTVDGKPKKLFSDINNDGIEDILVLFVRSNNINSVEKNNLGAKYRLYNNAIQATDFSLISFANLGSKLNKQEPIPLGKYKVIQDIKILKNKQKKSDPLFISVSFGDHQKASTKLISFTDFEVFSILDIETDINSGYYLKDIDTDQIPEIIQYRQVLLEDGRTDLEFRLYQWNGTFFQLTRSKRVLKELSSYLNRVKKAIENNDRSALIQEAFPKLEAYKYRAQTNDIVDVLKIIFKPMDRKTIPIKQAKEIHFAEIRENPFSVQNRQKSQAVQIYCRMFFSNRSSDFYKATIVLNENPFTEKQYYFTY